MCTQDSAQKGSVVTDHKITRDEPYGILSTFIVRNIRDKEREYTLCYPVRRHQDANAFQPLQQHLRQTRIVKRPEIPNTGCSRNVRRKINNEGAIIVGVEGKFMKYGKIIETIQSVSQKALLYDGLDQ